MKKKLVALILVAVLLLSSVPVFAAETYSVNPDFVGKADNPLTVSYDDKVNYLSLGDSIAYGFGLDLTFADVFAGGAKKRFGYDAKGGYANLIETYLSEEKLLESYYQRAVCSARIEDVCTLIDADEYPGDDFYNKVLRTMMMRGIYDDVRSAKDLDEEKTMYTVPTDNQLNEDFCSKVEDADFITLSAGGNNLFSYLFLSESTLKNYGLDVGEISVDLSKYYGKSVAAAFNLLKNSTVAKAKLLDKVTSNKEKETTYADQVENLFTTIAKVFYTMAAYNEAAPELLDLIHEKNPDAVVALTSMPYAFADYDLQVGSFLIDLGKIIKPFMNVLNDVLKSAAEERSSYVRYIDITDADLIAPTEEWSDKIVEIGELKDFISANLASTHPSYYGHKQIADEIMYNFSFEKSDRSQTIFKSLINSISNIWTNILSKSGIIKIKNLLTTIKNIDLSGLIKLAWK